VRIIRELPAGPKVIVFGEEPEEFPFDEGEHDPMLFYANGTFIGFDGEKTIIMKENGGQSTTKGNIARKLALGYFMSTEVYAVNHSMVLENKNQIPDNAFLISVSEKRPLWIQLCKNGFIITRGGLWGNCDIGEVTTEKYALERADEDEWAVLLPRVEETPITNGIYRVDMKRKALIKTGTRIETKNVVFSNANYTVWKNNQHYYDSMGYEIPVDHVENFVSVTTGEGKHFFPLATINGWNLLHLNFEKIMG